MPVMSFTGSVPEPFPYPPGADAFVASYPNPTTVVYTYKAGGIAGTTIATLTVIYADANQRTILSGAWT